MNLRGLFVAIVSVVLAAPPISGQETDIWERFRQQVDVSLPVPSPKLRTVDLSAAVIAPIAEQHLPGWGRARALKQNTKRLRERIAKYQGDAVDLKSQRAFASSLMLLLITEHFPTATIATPLETVFCDDLGELGAETVEAWKAFLPLEPTDRTHHYLACSHFLCGRLLLRPGPHDDAPSEEDLRLAIEHFSEALRLWKHLDRINPLDSPFAHAIDLQLQIILACHHARHDYEGMIDVIKRHDDWMVAYARQLAPERQYLTLAQHFRRLGRLQFHVGDGRGAAQSLKHAFVAFEQHYQLQPNRLHSARELLKLANEAAVVMDSFTGPMLVAACEPVVSQAELLQSRELQAAFIVLLTQVGIDFADNGDRKMAAEYLSRAIEAKRSCIISTLEGESGLFSIERVVPDRPMSTATIIRDRIALSRYYVEAGDRSAALAELTKAVERWEDLFRIDTGLQRTAAVSVEAFKATDPKQAVRRYRVSSALKRERFPLPPVLDAYRDLASQLYFRYATLLAEDAQEHNRTAQREMAQDVALKAAALSYFDVDSMRRLVATKRICEADDVDDWEALLPSR